MQIFEGSIFTISVLYHVGGRIFLRQVLFRHQHRLLIYHVTVLSLNEHGEMRQKAAFSISFEPTRVTSSVQDPAHLLPSVRHIHLPQGVYQPEYEVSTREPSLADRLLVQFLLCIPENRT